MAAGEKKGSSLRSNVGRTRSELRPKATYIFSIGLKASVPSAFFSTAALFIVIRMAELLTPGTRTGAQSAYGAETTHHPAITSVVSPVGVDTRTSNPAAGLWLCGFIAVLVWLLYFNFGRAISYGGDEFGLLRPAVNGSLLDSLHANIRPLEYLVIRLSFVSHFPFWLLVSLCSYVATAVLTLRFVDLFRRDGVVQLWKILLCATSPLAAQAYFRVDTIAQGLANLFTVLLAILVVECLRASEPEKIRGIARRVAVVGILCLLSKETTYGMVLGGSVVLWLRHRAKVLPLLIGPVLLLFVGLAWAHFGALEYSDHSRAAQYGLKANPLYWLFSLVFSVVVALSPVPTAPILTGSADSGYAMLALCVIGALLAFASLALYVPRRVHLPVRVGWVSRIVRGEFAHRELLLLLVLCSLVPSMFVKAAELYATQALPYLKAMLLLAIPTNVRVLDRVYWGAVSLMWVLASCINLMFYSIVLGAHPSTEIDKPRIERWLYAQVERAVAHRARDYSIYAYPAAFIPQHIGDCYVDPREPRICLPKDIVSGVPTLRENP